MFFRKIAKKIDINDDGFLTEEELKKWVQENHMKYLLKNAVDYIADVDLNNDSKMSFKEYEDSHFVPGNNNILSVDEII
jgi:Ca2+-binding EF-hand superfamily protein